MTPGKPIQPDRSRFRIPALGAVIAAAAFAAYHNSFLGQLAFDDVPAITDNPSIRHLSNLKAVLSPPSGGFTVSGRPLLNFSLALDYAISGKHVWSYHATNLLIHILASLVLFGIMRRTLRRMPAVSSAGTPLAFATALLWAVHPLQTEAVTYIIQRAESLMALFYLLTLYFFIRYTEADTRKFLTARSGRIPSEPFLQEGREDREGRHLGGLFIPDPATETTAVLPDLPDLPVKKATAPQLLPDLPDLPVKKTNSTSACLPTFLLKKRWRILSVACCLLGMATKEVMVSAPVMVLLYDRTFLAGTFAGAWRKRRGYYIGLAGTWVLLGWLLLNNSTRGRTVGVNAGIRPIDYWLTQFHAIVHYLRLVVWPRPLVIDYGTHVARSLGDVWPYVLIVAALVAGTVRGFFSPTLGGAARLPRRSAAKTGPETLGSARQRLVERLAPRRLRRRPSYGCEQASRGEPLHLQQPLSAAAAFCGIFFFAILAPTCLIPVVVQVMAEHRMYLALAPVLAVAVVGAYRFLEWLATGPVRPVRQAQGMRPLGGLLAACVAAAVVLGFVTERRNDDYRNELTLWGKTAAESPDNPRAVYNYGLALADAKDVKGAMIQYQRALELKPDYPEAHNNLGIALSQTGHWNEAMAEFRIAAEQDPTFGKAFYNIGNVYMHEQRLTDAINCFEEAERLAPDYSEIYNRLGIALTKEGRPEDAVPVYEHALDLKPDDVYVENNLGAVLDSLNRIPEAIACYRAALKLNPKLSKTHNDLGTALAQTGHLDEATAQFELAVQLDPKFYLARLNLGHALMLSGRTQEAQDQYREAALLPPTDSTSDYGPDSSSDPSTTP